MKRSVIHDNHGTLIKRRKKLAGKPEFKQAAIHRSAILKRRNDMICHFSGNNAAAFILSSADPSEYLLPPRCIPIFPIQVCIHPTFVYIGNLFRRYVLDLLLIRRYFFLILLLISGRLFFLVIL